MTNSQLVGIVVTVAVYVALIAFVLYRQMTAQPLRLRRLVLLPAILAVFGIQQLSRQQLSLSAGTIAYLGFNLVVGAAAGVWRGTTFRLWQAAGTTMVRGTLMTLAAWGVLIVIRAGFALATHAIKYSQGVVIGELLLALTVTFAAQNIVIWVRATQLTGVPALPEDGSLVGRSAVAYSGTHTHPE